MPPEPQTMTRTEFAQKIKAQYPVYANLPDEDLASKMLAKYPVYQSQIRESAPPSPSAPAKPMTMLGRPVKPEVAAQIEQMVQSEKERTAAGASIMPQAMGAVGGIVGGLPGAAIGGGVGKAVQQHVLRSQGDPSVPTSAVDQAIAMGTSALTEGVMQGTGQALVAGAGRTAKWLMNRATTRVSERLMRDFPDLSDTLIDHALTVSQGGYDKALKLLRLAKAKATAAISKAESAGVTVPIEFTTDIAESFKTGLLEQAIKSGALPVPANAPIAVASKRLTPKLQQFFAQIDGVADGGTLALSPKQADLLKTQLQKESRALYANRNAPNGPRAVEAEATMKAEFASRLNDALASAASGYKAANAEAQTFIGATRGIKQAIRPNGNLMQAMVRPAVGAMLGGGGGYAKEGSASGALAGAAAGVALASPRGMSMEAIALKHPAVQQFLKQLPRGAYAALMMALQSETPPTPPPR